MSVNWPAYRSGRRRSLAAWALLAIAGLSLLSVLFWFFTAGQFAAAGPSLPGPTAAPVFEPGWMKPVPRVHSVPPGTATDVLAGLPVKGRAGKDGYDRAAFGPAWLDVDHNGCDTRNDILRRDLAGVLFMEGSRCTVAGGTFADPYTARGLSFTRGPDSSQAVQIDHVVALADAWQKGAQRLSPAQRSALANDPLNLIAADGAANQEKGAGDAATWLPPNKSIRCHYVARQISVKAAYGLWVTAAEKDAMDRVLGSCPGQETIRTR